MNDPTALRQYSINQLPDDPSQIISGSFTTGVLAGIGATVTVTYQKVGNLYFSISVATPGAQATVGRVTGGGSIAIVQATIDNLFSVIGLTVNTYYLDTQDDVFCIEDNAGTWQAAQQSPVANICTSFLAN